MRTPEGQAIIQEACREVKQLMLIQMVEEQRQMLSQAQKEVQSCPMETIKSLRKEIKSLRAQLLKLQRASFENKPTEDIVNSAENQVNRRPTEPEDTPKPNNPEIES